MSENFENNTNGFENEQENTDSPEGIFSSDASENQNQSQNESEQFVLGEYHFSYQNPENSDLSGTDEPKPENADDSAQNAQTSDFDAGGYFQQTPQQPQSNAYYGQNQNQSAPQPGYTPYNWNQPGYTQPNMGGQPQQNAQNGGYYANPQPQYNGQSQYGTGYSRPTPPPQPPKKKSSAGKIVAIVAVIAVVVIAVAGIITSSLKGSPEASVQSTTSPTQAAEPAVQEEQNDNQYLPTNSSNVQQLSAVDVAQKVRKSVVGVMTYQNSQLSGEGSGVVMGLDSTGQYTYIITCAHVINESGATFGVLSLEGQRYEAELVATDTRTDIGVLRVETTELPAAEFGDSTVLQVGETVYAIGNPGGSEYFGSMTDGIVSAIDRSVSSTYNITCIQHNAAINPGNSGGALVNSAGQVIGINSSKIAATDYEGMGFAIPMATVSSVINDLIQYGYVPNRPKLGIEYAPVDQYQLYSMVVAIKGLPAGSLVIAGISTDSSLANTDAQVGDMIIGVNGTPMDTSNVLLDLIDTGAVGDTLTLNLCRVDNRSYQVTKFDVTITLVEDKGDSQQVEETTVAPGDYYYGGASSFDDFFNDYFGGFGGFGH